MKLRVNASFKHVMQVGGMPTKLTKRSQKVNKAASIDRRRQVIAEMYLKGSTQAAIGEAVGLSQVMIGRELRALRDLWIAEALLDFNEKKAIEIAKIDNLERIAYEAWERSCQNAETVTEHVERELRDAPHQPAKSDQRENTMGLSSTRPASQQSNGSQQAYASSGSKSEASGTNAEKLKARRKIGDPTEPAQQMMTAVKETLSKKSVGQSGNPAFLQRVSWCIETRLRLMGFLDNDKPVQPNNNFLVINFDEMAKRPTDMEADVIEAEIIKAGPGNGVASLSESNGHSTNGHAKHIEGQ